MVGSTWDWKQCFPLDKILRKPGWMVKKKTPLYFEEFFFANISWLHFYSITQVILESLESTYSFTPSMAIVWLVNDHIILPFVWMKVSYTHLSFQGRVFLLGKMSTILGGSLTGCHSPSSRYLTWEVQRRISWRKHIPSKYTINFQMYILPW